MTPLSEGRQTLGVAISTEGELKALAAPWLHYQHMAGSTIKHAGETMVFYHAAA